MSSSRDASRFELALEDSKSVTITASPDQVSARNPQSSGEWGDVAKMLRDHVAETESGISLLVQRTSQGTEEFSAIWRRAEREPLEGEFERGMSEDAMDTLIFRDES